MAASPRPGATLLLLLPPPASGNEGGAVGGCSCKKPEEPPRDLTALAQEVLSYQACYSHFVRFRLRRGQICGLKNAAWVIRLQELWEQKEAAQIDARRGEKGSRPALNSPTALLPCNANPPMLSTARPTVPQGPTNGPPEPHGPTDGLWEPHGRTDGLWEPHGCTDGPPEPHGSTAQPTDGALPSDPVGGSSVAPRQGEMAGDRSPPAQLRPPPMAVLALLGIVLGLVGAVTYLLCRRHQGAQCGGDGRGPPRDPAVHTKKASGAGGGRA